MLTFKTFKKSKIFYFFDNKHDFAKKCAINQQPYRNIILHLIEIPNTKTILLKCILKIGFLVR